MGGRAFRLDDYSYTGYKLSQVGLGDAIPCHSVNVTATGDITGALDAAVTQITALGGGTIYIPAGTFTVSSTVNILASNIRIAGAGSASTTVQVASSYNPTDQLTEAPFTFRGGWGVSYAKWQQASYASASTTMGDVARGDQSVTLTSATGFAVGDWVVQQQYFWPAFTAANSASTWTSAPGGTDSSFSFTFCFPLKIAALAGNVATLDAPIPWAMKNSDATVRFFKPAAGLYIENVGINGLTLQVQANANGPGGWPIGTALAFVSVFNG